MDKFCGKCGTKLAEEAMFCKNCGASLNEKQKKQFGEIIKNFFNKIISNKIILSIILGVVALIVVIALLISFAFANRYKSAFNNYIDLVNGDFAKAEFIFPPQFFEKTNTDIDDKIEDYEEEYEELIDSLEEEYGEDITFSYSIVKKEDIDEEPFDNIKQKLKSKYSIAKSDITNGYKVGFVIEIDGSENTDFSVETAYVVEIDNKWYIVSEKGIFGLGML